MREILNGSYSKCYKILTIFHVTRCVSIVRLFYMQQFAPLIPLCLLCPSPFPLPTGSHQFVFHYSLSLGASWFPTFLRHYPAINKYDSLVSMHFPTSTGATKDFLPRSLFGRRQRSPKDINSVFLGHQAWAQAFEEGDWCYFLLFLSASLCEKMLSSPSLFPSAAVG